MTAACLVVWRLLSAVPLPIVSPQLASAEIQQNTHEGAFAVLAGAPLETVSVVALGLRQFFYAFVFLWMLWLVSPYMRKRWQNLAAKNRDLAWGTLGLAAFAAFGKVQVLTGGQPRQLTSLQGLASIILLVLGTMFLLGLGTLIDRWGVPAGYGVWFLFGVQELHQELQNVGSALDLPTNGATPWLAVAVYLLVAVIVVISLNAVFSAVRSIPLTGLNRTAIDNRDALPIHFLIGGLMVPIGLALTFINLPWAYGSMIGLSRQRLDQLWSPFSASLLVQLVYSGTYVVLVVGGCVLATWANFDPEYVVRDIRRHGRVLRALPIGLRPEAYLGRVVTALNLVGSLWLATILVLIPAVFRKVFSGAGFTAGGATLLLALTILFETVRRIRWDFSE